MSGRALIIDKDAEFAGRLDGVLSRYGFSVELSTTGRNGIERAKATTPELIVLCVELEDTSGYSICAKIKKDPDLKDIPLVITSEKATQETFDHHKKLKTRAQVYLMKPFDPEQLMTELSAHVPLDSSGPQPPPIPAAGLVEIEDIDVDSADEVGGDDDAFGDAGPELDEAIASLSDEPPPLPAELGIEGVAGLPEPVDEDDIRTSVGSRPNDEANRGPRSSSIELSSEDLLRRLKEAERLRDEALASRRATQAQLEALAAGSSQLPQADPASREVLAVKKELNAKEREILSLRDAVQERDRQLLDAKDREAELEDQVVQSEDATSRAERARVEAESRIAGAEARAEEIERSSRAAIEERDEQLEHARTRIQELEGELERSQAEADGLRNDLADRDALLNERDGVIRERDQRIDQLEQDLKDSHDEASDLRDQLGRAGDEIEGLTARSDGLDRDLEEARGEIEALQGALADTEDRLARALRRIREDEDIRGKARQAIEITLNLLTEADYSGDGEEGVVSSNVEREERDPEAPEPPSSF